MDRAHEEATVGVELGKVLDRIESEEAALRDLVTSRKERIAGLRERASELRDVLAGRKGSQGVILATIEAAARVGKGKP